MWQPHEDNALHQSRGELTASSRGTLVTANATTNLKGSWVSLGSATGFVYEAITVCISRASVGDNYVIDIGIDDGAGNNFVLVPDLYFAAQKQLIEQGLSIYIPIHVPAGALLEARCAAVTSSPTCDVCVIGHATGLRGSPGFSRAATLFTPASSRGIAIDPGGTANTKGAWAQMTASCPEDIGAMFGLIGYNNDVARAATASAIVDIGIGAAASEFVLYPNAFLGWGVTRDGPSNCPRIPLFACDVPKTTRIAARAACSINTAGDRTVDLALYGLVK